MSNPSNTNTKPVYLSNSRAVQSPPFTARVTRFFESAIQFGGLYFVTLLSFDARGAAESSSYASQNNPSLAGHSGPTGGSRLGGGGGSGGGSGGRPGGQRLGTVDQVRGPECGSCQ